MSCVHAIHIFESKPKLHWVVTGFSNWSRLWNHLGQHDFQLLSTGLRFIATASSLGVLDKGQTPQGEDGGLKAWKEGAEIKEAGISVWGWLGWMKGAVEVPLNSFKIPACNDRQQFEATACLLAASHNSMDLWIWRGILGWVKFGCVCFGQRDYGLCFSAWWIGRTFPDVIVDLVGPGRSHSFIMATAKQGLSPRHTRSTAGQ